MDAAVTHGHVSIQESMLVLGGQGVSFVTRHRSHRVFCNSALLLTDAEALFRFSTPRARHAKHNPVLQLSCQRPNRPCWACKPFHPAVHATAAAAAVSACCCRCCWLVMHAAVSACCFCERLLLLLAGNACCCERLLLLRTVVAGWRLLTNTANLHASTGQGTQGALCTGTWGLGLVASSGTQLDVQGCDAKLLQRRK